MVGGVITSGVMELMVFPVIYFMWRGLKLDKGMVPTGSGDLDETETFISRPSRELLKDPYSE